ncbi:MAG: DNA primase [Treponema sp.]|nr:DNA primase [Candidatus Treponema caballi]
MPKISRTTIDNVISRVDIVSLVGEYTRLEKRGSDYWGCCPFHNEKTPSFHVIPDRNMYKCFGCGAGGTTLNFYMEVEKVTYSEAILALAKKTGVEVIYDGNAVDYKPEDNKKDQYKELYTRVAGSFRYLLTSTEQCKDVREYLSGRGINEETAEKFKLGYAPRDRFWLKNFLRKKNYSDEFLNESGLFSKKNPDVSFFSDRLMFPICDRMGNVVAFSGRILHGDGPKYINSSDLIQYKKGETLFGFHLAKQSIRQQKAAILCEGNMDVIAYHQAGITWATAPLGTALTEDQLKILQPLADELYLSFDGDGAGQKATWRAILMARQFNFTVRIIRLSGGKDPAEILLNLGAENLSNQVNNAILDSTYLLSALADKYDISTPEGKTRASMDYFQYVDVLQSDIQKESCLEQLCETYQLKPEAVKADFENRSSALKKIETFRNKPDKSVEVADIKPNAEVRAMLAVISNLDFFPALRNSLTADDFEDATARDMFISLEECYREDSVTLDNIIRHCNNDGLQRLITKAVTTDEFTVNTEQTVKDSIRLIRKNSLGRKKEKLMNEIRQLSLQNVTLEIQQKLDALVTEKMNIDSELLKV